MKRKIQGKKKIEKFLIDSESDRCIYESILNDETCTVTRTEIFNDKNGQTYVTVWYEKEE